MRIKPLRSIAGDYGTLKRNRPAVIDDATAGHLIRRGLVVAWPEVMDGAEAGGTPSANPRKPAGPIGGRTGKAKSSSSSPRARAPRGSASKPAADAPGS